MCYTCQFPICPLVRVLPWLPQTIRFVSDDWQNCDHWDMVTMTSTIDTLCIRTSVSSSWQARTRARLRANWSRTSSFCTNNLKWVKKNSHSPHKMSTSNIAGMSTKLWQLLLMWCIVCSGSNHVLVIVVLSVIANVAENGTSLSNCKIRRLTCLTRKYAISGG